MQRASSPDVRRAFVDTPFGQIHVRVALDSEVGPDAHALFCLHPSPASSLTYAEILPFLAHGRRVIAVDTPGFGESFRPTAQPGIADYARWIAAVPAALGIDRFDVMGMFTGAAIAAEMALQQGRRVRRVVLAGPPLFTPEQQTGFVVNAWPERPEADGSHLIRLWQRTMGRPLPEVPFERRCDGFNEYYRGGTNAIWGELAVAVYNLGDTLPQLDQDVLVIQPKTINGDAAGAARLLRCGRLQTIPENGLAMMQAAPALVAAAVTEFLDGPEFAPDD